MIHQFTAAPAQPEAGSRDWYSFEAIRALPRILQLVDRNPYSPTYGCFDREYWHYRTIDFPCGMSQEFVLALALAHATPFPDNPFFRSERLREIAIGAMHFARKSAHADGSCDDYFPYERALGAVVFSLYSLTESYRVLGVDDAALLEFFARRGDWLRRHNETGKLANHQALAALALENVHVVTGEARFREASHAYVDLTLSWQHEEGWFQEYEGADPGYHTCTIDFLAKLQQKNGDLSLTGPLRRAVDFAALFMHPDGSYGGEYGSRNTYHFYPHGFELASRYSPRAGQIAEMFLKHAMPRRTRYYNEDNRMLAHYVYDWMQAWIDYNPRRYGLLDAERGEFERWLPGAKLYVVRTPAYHAVAALSKGGVVKAFTEDGAFLSDTGIIAESAAGKVIVAHLIDDHVIECAPGARECTVSGVLSKRRTALATPMRQIAFRLLTSVVGRFFPGLIRSVIQKLLITGKPRTTHQFRRTLRFLPDAVEITDVVRPDRGDRLIRIGTGSDATSIYVANSNVFQSSVMLPWQEWQGVSAQLLQGDEIEMKRVVSPGGKS